MLEGRVMLTRSCTSRGTLLCVTLGVALASPGLLAEMYKWIDDGGQVQYSQSPPPGRPAQTIKPPPKVNSSVQPFSDLRGKIKNDTYVSPGAIYRVKLPPLLQPGAIIEDEQIGDSQHTLRMRDDLGVFYAITVIMNEEPKKIPAIIDAFRSAAQLIEKTVVTTPRGEETRLLLFKKGGSHLREITFKGKEKVESALDAVKATSLFVFRNHIFVVSSGGTPLAQLRVPGPGEHSDKEYAYKLAKERLEQLLDGLVLQGERETR